MVIISRIVKSVTKSQFNCQVEQIWDIITNNKDYSWRSDLSKIEVIDNNHFIEYTKNNFPTYFEITKIEKPKRYEFNLSNENIKGHWVGIFNNLNDKTEILFEEEIEVSNVVMMIVSKIYLKSQQRRYIKDLKRKIGGIK